MTRNDERWLRAVDNHPDSNPLDVETAKQIQAQDTLAADFAASDPVQRLVTMDLLEVRPGSTADEYDYLRYDVMVSGGVVSFKDPLAGK